MLHIDTPELVHGWADSTPGQDQQPNHRLWLDGAPIDVSYDDPAPMDGMKVEARVVLDSTKDQPAYRVLEYRIASELDLFIKDVPRSWVAPRAQRLPQLVHLLLSSVHTAELRDLSQIILTSPELAPRFFQAPASAAHHHSFNGGLACHSMEVALLAQKHICCQGPDASYEIELVTCAALLHDIGKALLPKQTDHDKAGAEFVSFTMAQEGYGNGDATIDLLNVLRRKQTRVDSPVHRALAYADQCSAGSSAEKMAFARAPKSSRVVPLNVKGPRRFYQSYDRSRIADAPPDRARGS